MKAPRYILPVLDLFSSVRFGVVLLSLLFIYCSVGSAGILYPVDPNVFDLDNWNVFWVRKIPALEMTEFEWFHWWPFKLLIGLICATLIVTTLRRIPFRPLNFGVWTIHSGLIILAIGSVWYFSSKVEGQSPVFRRRIEVSLPGAAGSLLAMPGARLSLQGDAGRYDLEVVEINPSWELRSGDDDGAMTYAVSVRITAPDATFVRQLLAGYPQYTEDVIPGRGRAVNEIGTALFDPSIEMSLAYEPQRFYYISHTDALYLRAVGDSEWTMRPISGLPRYNEYIADVDDVRLPAELRELAAKPLDIALPPASAHDPLAGTTLRVRTLLPFAAETSELEPQGVVPDPYAIVEFSGPNMDTEELRLHASKPRYSDADPALSSIVWIDHETELEAITSTGDGLIAVRVPSAGYERSFAAREFDLSDPAFIDLGDSGVSIRVRDIRDHMVVEPSRPAVSFVSVDVRTSQGEFNRWVFDDPRANRDQVANSETGEIEMVEFNDSVEITYAPPPQRSVLTFVAGPTPDRLRLIVQDAAPIELREGRRVQLDSTVWVTVKRYWPFSVEQVKPRVFAMNQRTNQADARDRMIQVALPGKDDPVEIWLGVSDFPLVDASAAARFAYRPRRITLSDGREIELLYARQRAALPMPVALDDFVVDYHVGGFTGDNLSVQNWQSIVRFDDGETWSDARIVSVNQPAEHGSFSYFQAMWDPPAPEAGYGGLNFTVLGVGNRNGVYVQLLGCIMVVLGLLYAFYVKPIIKQRRRDAVYASISDAAGDFPETSGDRNLADRDRARGVEGDEPVEGLTVARSNGIHGDANAPSRRGSGSDA